MARLALKSNSGEIRKDWKQFIRKTARIRVKTY